MNKQLRTALFNSIQTHLCVAKAARSVACINKVEPLINLLATDDKEFSIREYENIIVGQLVRGVSLTTNSSLSIQFSKAGATIDIAIGVMDGKTSISIEPQDDIVSKTCKFFQLIAPEQKVA